LNKTGKTVVKAAPNYTENERSSNTNTTQYRGRTQALSTIVHFYHVVNVIVTLSCKPNYTQQATVILVVFAMTYICIKYT